MLNSLLTPEPPKFVPVPAPNPRERLTLPKPSYRELDPFLSYEQKEIAALNFVDKTMASVGYQEGEMYLRPDRTLIRQMEGSAEEDLDLSPALAVEGENSAIGSSGVGRVEYDMDEQDVKWLEALNRIRTKDGVGIIKPAVFEITMTKVEKEWHALEKRIPKPTRRHHRRKDQDQARQRRSMENQVPEKNQTANVPSAMMVTVRTPTQSYFVMAAISQCIKSVMVCHTYPKANGYAGNASLWVVLDRAASSARMKEERSSKPTIRSGLICSVLHGFQKSTSAIPHLWSLSQMWRKCLLVGGSSPATSAAKLWGQVFNAAMPVATNLFI